MKQSPTPWALAAIDTIASLGRSSGRIADDKKVVVVVHQFIRRRQPFSDGGSNRADEALVRRVELLDERSELSLRAESGRPRLRLHVALLLRQRDNEGPNGLCVLKHSAIFPRISDDASTSDRL